MSNFLSNYNSSPALLENPFAIAKGFFYVPGSNAAIKLLLRRTLVRHTITQHVPPPYIF